jgi:hypothetical protein
LNERIGQHCGLGNDGSIRQLLYKLHYYEKKCADSYRAALILLYCGGDTSRKHEIPKKLFNIFGNIAEVRWLSSETQAEALLEILQIPAPECMIQYMKTTFTEAIMLPVLVACQVILKPSSHTRICQPSALQLVLYFMANTSAGGKNGEKSTNFKQLLALCQCPEHQISLCVLASMRPMHLKFLSFSNGASKTISSTVLSTRLLENSVFIRAMLQTISEAAFDWQQGIPGLSYKLSLIANGDRNCLDRWNSILREECLHMYVKALKYMRDMDLKIGFSFSLLTDPVIAPSVASGWLQALHTLDLIDDEVPTITIPSPRAPAASSPTSAWNISSSEFAYPEMTFPELTKAIRENIVGRGVSKVRDHAKKLGLLHRHLRMELLSITKGSMAESLAQSCQWKIGDPVSSYWNHLLQLYPLVTESLVYNFGSVSLTTTAVECSFSVANNIIEPSMSTTAISNSCYYQLNMRPNIVSNMEALVHHKDGTESKQTHIFDTASSRHEYTTKLAEEAAKATEFSKTHPPITTRQADVKRSRAAELEAIQPQLEQEINTNLAKRQRSGVLEAREIASYTDKLTTAKINGTDKIVASPSELLRATIAKLGKENCSKLLLHFYPREYSSSSLKRLNFRPDMIDLMERLVADHPNSLEKKRKRRPYSLNLTQLLVVDITIYVDFFIYVAYIEYKYTIQLDTVNRNNVIIIMIIIMTMHNTQPLSCWVDLCAVRPTNARS